MITRSTVIALTLVTTFIGIPGFASAQDSTTRNVDQYTCKDVMRGDDDGRTTATAFLHGYLLGKSGKSDFDIDVMAKQTDAFTEKCLESPNEKAINVMTKLK